MVLGVFTCLRLIGSRVADCFFTRLALPFQRACFNIVFMLWLWCLTHGVREWTLGHVVQEDDICFILFDEVYAAEIR